MKEILPSPELSVRSTGHTVRTMLLSSKGLGASVSNRRGRKDSEAEPSTNLSKFTLHDSLKTARFVALGMQALI
ncbi:hypothetical protein WP12_00830 [Sphingomonas sp. SRS2]|nr:hypothetical protein WP12_00830 [Sphingomonas sp. SRS2]